MTCRISNKTINLQHEYDKFDHEKVQTIDEYLKLLWAESYKNSTEILIQDTNTLKLSKKACLYADENAILLSDHYEVDSKFLETLFQYLFEYKTIRKKTSYINHLKNIIGSLLIAHQIQAPVITLRGKENSSNAYTSALEILAKKGFIYHVIGSNQKELSNSSWIQPTPFLRHLFNKYMLYFGLKENNLIIKKNSQKEVVNTNRMATRNKNKFNNTKQQLIDFNKLLSRHDFQLKNDVFYPHLYRVFNLNDNMNLGGRFYGSFQSLPSGNKANQQSKKPTRKQILIDGEETVEPDFTAIHYHIIYALKGRQLEDDPYDIPGFKRSFIKHASLVLLNSKNSSNFEKNISRSSNPILKHTHVTYLKELENYRNSKATLRPNLPDCLKGFIPGVPDFLEGNDLFNALCKVHEPLRNLFNDTNAENKGNNIGLTLQNYDAKIMSKVIEKLIVHNIAGLPIHDSVRCKKSDLNKVINIMKDSYGEVMNHKKVTNYEIEVKYNGIKESKRQPEILNRKHDAVLPLFLGGFLNKDFGSDYFYKDICESWRTHEPCD